MPTPSILCMALVAGLITAFAARNELCVSPRTYIATRAFRALIVYGGLILLPISIYFYFFHGDWFLIYSIDTAHIPSAVVLLGLLIEFFMMATGFMAGAQLVRRQRSQITILLIILFLLGAIATIVLSAKRLALVGTYRQYHGGFGLQHLGSSYLLTAVILMSVVLFVGLTALVIRLNWGAKHPSQY